LYYSATIHYMGIREEDGFTVDRDGVSLPEAVHEILMRNYARLPMLEDETHELPFTRQTHLVPSPAADTAEYTGPIGAE
jgi:hypothetical protein